MLRRSMERIKEKAGRIRKVLDEIPDQKMIERVYDGRAVTGLTVWQTGRRQGSIAHGA